MHLILVAAIVLAPLSVVWAAAEPATPRIVEVRVGVSNHYKIGHWTPVRVTVDGVGALRGPRIEVAVPDNDGVMTVASAPVESPGTPDRRATAEIHTRVGRLDSPVRVSLVDGNGTRVDDTTLPPVARSSDGARGIVELPATGELIIALSSEPFGLAEAVRNSDGAGGVATRRTVHLDRVDELPMEWFGYSGVDLLVISAGDGALSRALRADAARYAALVRWVELGGRLAILCGGEGSEEIVKQGGPLAELVPGKWAESVRLTETGALEQFAEPAGPIGRRGRGPALWVPKLSEIDGKVEAYAGQRAADLPLVVRSARGFGEVTFAAVDVTKPPLAEWSGRGALLQALLRPYLAEEKDQEDASQKLMTRGYDDVSGALRQRLGRSFAGVSLVPFSAVAVFAIAYLLVLGPADYFFVHRWVRRPWVAWVTFPIIVLAFGMVALAIGEWRKGPWRARLNGLELIDVDTIAGQARGSYWAALYTPRARQFDLSFEPAALSNDSQKHAHSLLSWWGLPGAGIGGMDADGGRFKLIQEAYRYGPKPDALEGVPVLTSSSKSLTAGWTAPVGSLLDAQLADDDGLVRGTIVNRTGRLLRNVRLLYGGWGYRLGNVEPGGRLDVHDRLDPHRVKTIVTSAALGASAGGAAAANQMVAADRASASGLLNLLMFYNVAGGEAFVRLPNRYQAYCDLSRHLYLGRAILVADMDGGGSRLIDRASGEPLGAESDVSAVVVRFVLPVSKNEVEL